MILIRKIDCFFLQHVQHYHGIKISDNVHIPTEYSFIITMDSDSMAISTTTSIPQNLSELIQEVMNAPMNDGASRADILLAALRKYHFWPALQMKKFYDRSGLVLLHNTYKRNDVDSFKNLYDECRSVVLDLQAPIGNNVVVTLAHSIPERCNDKQYMAIKNVDDKCELSYEGTVFHTYEHNGRWYFSTTSCPMIDSSKYFHPTKTHGAMLDEILTKYFPNAVQPIDETEKTDKQVMREHSRALRDAFCAHLDVKKAYSFLLVHHENRHVMDYTSELGENYGVLFHLATRDRDTLVTEDLSSQPFASIGIKYSTVFDTPEDALTYINNNNVYGFVVKRPDGMLKVSVDDIVVKEECDLGNPNKWQNMLWVYMQNKPHYHIDDYIKQYAPNLSYPIDGMGRTLAPTYIIHTVVCTMRDILYGLYLSTTSYYPNVQKFKMNKDIDASLAPILRFHLAQLRHLQVTSHTHGLLTPKAVYHYICHHQTLKNIRVLIHHIATSGGAYKMKYRQAECFGILDQLLFE